jgi:3-oxoacyl-[acyl-carrier-protein] synthase II
VHDFDPHEYLTEREVRRTDRSTQLGVAAALDALADARSPQGDPARHGVVVGTGMGGLLSVEEHVRIFIDKGPSRLSPFLVPMIMPNATAGMLAIRLGWTGPNISVATACASGSHAIGEAARLIRDGSSDVVLGGATDSLVSPIVVSAFARMGALSTRNDDPIAASRPFDRDRSGFVIAEGAAFVVLERLDRARDRGAQVYGEILGYGRNSDAHHVAIPSPGGAGAAECMRLALEDADVDPSEVGHINAHGTSTPINDRTEAEAIEKAFALNPPPVAATKGVAGHAVGAAGAIEVVASLLAAANGIVPPTANYDTPDPQIALDIVAGAPRRLDSNIVLSNSFGFGGHNASLVLSGE